LLGRLQAFEAKKCGGGNESGEGEDEAGIILSLPQAENPGPR